MSLYKGIVFAGVGVVEDCTAGRRASVGEMAVCRALSTSFFVSNRGLHQALGCRSPISLATMCSHSGRRTIHSKRFASPLSPLLRMGLVNGRAISTAPLRDSLRDGGTPKTWILRRIEICLLVPRARCIESVAHYPTSSQQTYKLEK